MSKIETIAAIVSRLETLDEQSIDAVADFVETMATPSELPRALTPHELQLIEQSKADFREGRTYTMEESMAYIDAQLERRRIARSTS